MRKIFGTGTLHWLNPKSRDMVIEKAINMGFYQFDTSNIYGLGITNKYLGSLGLPSKIFFSAKLGLKSSETFSSSRIEFGLRKLLLYKSSKIREDNCYSNWKRQFEKQLKDLRIDKFQRLLLHERYISLELWDLFQKFLSEYKAHFEEYGVSASWFTLRPSIKKILNEKLLIQTTPDILKDNIHKDFNKLTLYGISQLCNENSKIRKYKNIEGVIYFSSKPSRIESFKY